MPLNCPTCNVEVKTPGPCPECYAVESRLPQYIRHAKGREILKVICGQAAAEELTAKVMHLNTAVKELRDDHNTAGQEFDSVTDDMTAQLVTIGDTLEHVKQSFKKRIVKLEKDVYSS